MEIKENKFIKSIDSVEKEKLKTIDFSTIFSNLKNIENVNNGYSMVILGECLSVLKQDRLYNEVRHLKN